MAGVELSIVEPENDAAFMGIPTVTLRGKLEDLSPELAGVPFYYRWYSSLYPADAQHEQYSMNVTALTEAGAPFPYELGMGSHVITFAASDRLGETNADFEAIQHGGVTGGLEGDNRCVIHVFKANIIAPSNGETPPGVSLPQAGLILQAEAPPLWAKSVNEDGNPPYEFNNDYHEYNRLRYRWRFEPFGSPTGRPTLEFIPDPKDLDFDPGSDPVCVAYQPPLPATAMGNYRIVLYVEDKQDEGIGQHEDEVFVNLT